jgi:NADP oxidoreductase coenzyme F420-dependent
LIEVTIKVHSMVRREAAAAPSSIYIQGFIMKVTVIGSGNMGSAFVKQLHAAGHTVSVTGLDAAKASALAAQYAGVSFVEVQYAAEGSDAIVLATPYDHAAAALKSLGGVAGKVVIDITNPLTPDYMVLTVGHDTSAAEQIAKAVPDAELVKGFNTIFAQVPPCLSPATARRPNKQRSHWPRAWAFARWTRAVSRTRATSSRWAD